MMDDLTSSAPAGAQDDSSAPLVTVCISAMPDGTYQVSQQDADGDQDDMGAGSGEMSSGDAPHVAESIDDALNYAGQLLQAEASEGSDGEQENPNAPAKDPRAIWDQLAKKSDKARGVV